VHQPPPPALPLTLIMPLARPLVLKRTLLCASSLGIKKIVILNFNRVEKSLWSSSVLRPEAIQDQLVLGLEQAKDTCLPEVMLRERFKPFVEDELPELIKGTTALVAHPGTSNWCPRQVCGPVTLVIGPEGGLVDFELQKLSETGFQAIDLGQRILRIESVLPFLIGRIF
jgi:RsmE family RNA methyltransferase